MTTTIVQNNFPEAPEVKKESFKNSNKDISAFQQVLGNNSSRQNKEDKKPLSNKDINSANNEDDKVVKAEDKERQQIKSNKFPNTTNVAESSETKEIDSINNITQEDLLVTVNNIELPVTLINQDNQVKEVSLTENMVQIDLPKLTMSPVEKTLDVSTKEIVVEEQSNNVSSDAEPVKNLDKNFISNDIIDSSYLVSNEKSSRKESVNIVNEETISDQNIFSKEPVNKAEKFEIDSQQLATEQNSDVIVVPQAVNITQDQTYIDNNIDLKIEPNKIIDGNRIDNKFLNPAIENKESTNNVSILNQNSINLVRPNIDNKDNKNIDELKLNSLNALQNNTADDYNLTQDNLSDRRDTEYQNDDLIFDKIILNKNEEKITLSFKELSTDFAENIPHRIDQISLAVRAGLQNGKKEISLNMYPEALGNVDVKIEFDKDQVISVKIFVEKPETLRILVKDVAILEKSLAEVIKADDASLSFNLKDGGKGNEYQPADKIVNKSNFTDSSSVVSKNYQVNISSQGDGVNITV